MDVVAGSVVLSKAGHDKGRFMVVVRVEGRFAYVCDGKLHKACNPKLKNLKHIQPTSEIVNLPKTDKQLRKLLNNFGSVD